jgi:hypothetical protein
MRTNSIVQAYLDKIYCCPILLVSFPRLMEKIFSKAVQLTGLINAIK